MVIKFKIGDRVTFKNHKPDDPELLKVVAVYESRNVVMLKGIDKPWKGGTGIDSIEKANPEKSKPKPKKRRKKREKLEDYWP